MKAYLDFDLLRKFQELNEPKNHECLDEITKRWSHYLLGTALSKDLKKAIVPG